MWGLTVCTVTLGLWSLQDTRLVCHLQEAWSLPNKKFRSIFFNILTSQANTPYMCESCLCVVYCAFWTLVSTRYKISWHTSKRQHPPLLLGKKGKKNILATNVKLKTKQHTNFGTLRKTSQGLWKLPSTSVLESQVWNYLYLSCLIYWKVKIMNHLYKYVYMNPSTNMR